MEAAAADFGATYEHRPQLSSTQSTQQRTEEYVNRQIHLLSDTHSVKASIQNDEYAAHNYASVCEKQDNTSPVQQPSRPPASSITHANWSCGQTELLFNL